MTNSWHCEVHESFDPSCRDCRSSRPDRKPKQGAMLPHQMEHALESIHDNALKLLERYPTAYLIGHENPRYGEGGGTGISDPTGSSVVGARPNRQLVEDASHAVESSTTSLQLALYALTKLENSVDEAHPLTPGINERQRERPALREQLLESTKVKIRNLSKDVVKLERQIKAEKDAAAKQAKLDAAKQARRRQANTSAYEVTK